ncbi:uroporphyrinogen-III synthase [Mycobacterium dioxanotrophicus]|uniref:Uroporphyrinogen-III synthase n=1 Tax=Mycobacterium dioxanotrophicus TaxID=482462 RepID=A0A1Y0CCE3_9MYCO|nr:uroporphyrinogen-III synthase [Mycobacterium dioxanotrophicus]ART72933.1 uroporphyrinogen-III synthase [Mycobacterium dioxanotrophicus]
MTLNGESSCRTLGSREVTASPLRQNDSSTAGWSLEGRLIGVTAARKAREQIEMFQRRGADIMWAPALSLVPSMIDERELRRTTQAVVGRPADLFLATTGTGINSWFESADSWGLGHDLVRVAAGAEVLARGPKSAGALVGRGVRVDWSPRSECFADVLAHLCRRDLSGKRIIMQEHGLSQDRAAQVLRERGAEVIIASIYRVEGPESPARLDELLDLVVGHALDALTFTSAPAVASIMRAAALTGRESAFVDALRGDIVVACVGPVAADAFSPWSIPVVVPRRYRLGALVKLVESYLKQR